jgi:hypothetical protein
MSGAKFIVIAQGVGIALYKRAAFIVLILVVFQSLQITNLRSSIDDQKLDQDARSQESLAKALAENQNEQRKTRQYVRCLFLVPEGQRTDENLSKCGDTGEVETESTPASEASPVEQPAIAPAPPTSATQPAAVNYPTTSAPPEPERQESQGGIKFIQPILEELTGNIFKQ